MKIISTTIPGLLIIENKPNFDNRGYFSRIVCKSELAKENMDFNFVQSNLSFNEKAGTIRGMHYQLAPYQEAKIVTCLSGSILDVVVDLRKESKTYKNIFSIILNEKNFKSLYIPKGVAHGFQTLTDNSAVLYHMDEYYYEEYARGFRFNDTAFDIQWPVNNSITISDKDRAYSDFI